VLYNGLNKQGRTERDTQQQQRHGTMTRLMSKKDVQATLKQLREAGFTVEGAKGSYKVLDGDMVVLQSMPHSGSGPSLVTINDEYFA